MYKKFLIVLYILLLMILIKFYVQYYNYLLKQAKLVTNKDLNTVEQHAIKKWEKIETVSKIWF